MNRFSIALLAVLLVAGPLAEGGAAHPIGRCTLLVRPWVRADTLYHFTATARPDTLFVRQFQRPVPLVPAPQPDAPVTVAVYGQVARLDRLSPTLASVLEQRSGGIPQRVVLVRWDRNESCERDVHLGSAQWLAPNEQGFFATGPLAVRESPASPTFEIGPTEIEGGRVYLPAAFDRELRPSWWRRLLRPRPMTIEEYRLFYEAMPSWSEWEREPRTAAAALEEWARQHGDIAGREPARSAIEAMRAEMR